MKPVAARAAACAGSALAAVLGVVAFASSAAAAPRDGEAYRIETARSTPARIELRWFAAGAAAGAPRPAIIALHGCGGLRPQEGVGLAGRYREYARMFNAAGWHVVLPDSFDGGSRCAVAYDRRDVKVEDRRADVLAALAWLKSRPEVDARRIALVGWSNGATTALSAANAARTVHAQPLAGVAVFYPGCAGLNKLPFKVAVPTLMMLGASDDWTPAQPCIALAEAARLRDPEVTFVVALYPDSHHEFDSTRPVRFRPEVGNGNGAHAGGNPAARAASQAELMAFLKQVFR